MNPTTRVNLNVMTPEESPFKRFTEGIGGIIIDIGKVIFALSMAIVYTVLVPWAAIKVVFFM